MLGDNLVDLQEWSNDHPRVPTSVYGLSRLHIIRRVGDWVPVTSDMALAVCNKLVTFF